MNKYQYYWKYSCGERDALLKFLLLKENMRPLKILEVGTLRNLDFAVRASDGWSSFIWADYIKTFGGRFITCDISSEALSNARVALSDFDNIDYVLGDAINYITDDLDICYLDGGDNPIEMFNQFQKINRKKTLVICDDFHAKGHILIGSYKDYKVCNVNGKGHFVGIYERL